MIVSRSKQGFIQKYTVKIISRTVQVFCLRIEEQFLICPHGILGLVEYQECQFVVKSYKSKTQAVLQFAALKVLSQNKLAFKLYDDTLKADVIILNNVVLYARQKSTQLSQTDGKYINAFERMYDLGISLKQVNASCFSRSEVFKTSVFDQTICQFIVVEKKHHKQDDNQFISKKKLIQNIDWRFFDYKYDRKKINTTYYKQEGSNLYCMLRRFKTLNQITQLTFDENINFVKQGQERGLILLNDLKLIQQFYESTRDQQCNQILILMVLEKEPDNIEYTVKLAHTYYQLGKIDQCKLQVEKLPSKNLVAIQLQLLLLALEKKNSSKIEQKCNNIISYIQNKELIPDINCIPFHQILLKSYIENGLLSMAQKQTQILQLLIIEHLKLKLTQKQRHTLQLKRKQVLLNKAFIHFEQGNLSQSLEIYIRLVNNNAISNQQRQTFNTNIFILRNKCGLVTASELLSQTLLPQMNKIDGDLSSAENKAKLLQILQQFFKNQSQVHKSASRAFELKVIKLFMEFLLNNQSLQDKIKETISQFNSIYSPQIKYTLLLMLFVVSHDLNTKILLLSQLMEKVKYLQNVCLSLILKYQKELDSLSFKILSPEMLLSLSEKATMLEEKHLYSRAIGIRLEMESRQLGVELQKINRDHLQSLIELCDLNDIINKNTEELKIQLKGQNIIFLQLRKRIIELDTQMGSTHPKTLEAIFNIGLQYFQLKDYFRAFLYLVYYCQHNDNPEDVWAKLQVCYQHMRAQQVELQEEVSEYQLDWQYNVGRMLRRMITEEPQEMDVLYQSLTGRKYQGGCGVQP